MKLLDVDFVLLGILALIIAYHMVFMIYEKLGSRGSGKNGRVSRNESHQAKRRYK
jgi:predicted permease